ncbi:bifunctional lysine-specific demethylase and histidyl-hydroxylase NO66 isoform X2 [Condylostylus longicornis]|uniref:bifunctional lysine-specific demethylase and histidyl-hydroxylase NO66 isoform X2 n=1 Tax=Condylostylus longicornis TaxID=2530218 RepID=UPI00244DEC18|nr:bifunctional lysine-specific demethylase and histidyl-hydroxylase NO66 isoform X2 [Condylostylus longicornis]
MEEISAFAAYNLNKSKSKNKSKKKSNSSKFENGLNNSNKDKSNKKAKEAEKQAMINQILEQHFKKKHGKSNKRKKNLSLEKEEDQERKKTKFTTSTPRDTLVRKKKTIPKRSVELKKSSEKVCVSEPSSTSMSDKDNEEVFQLSSNKLKNCGVSFNNESETIVRNERNNCTKFGIQNEKITSETPKNNSIKDGETVLKWLLNGIDVTTFFAKYWEKTPCLIKRKNETKYYSKLLSFEMIDRMLIENHVEFTKNIDVTKYENGIRETLNPEGRALPGAVWEKYADGCSIRLLNPQTFLSSIFSINSTLQEYFHCMVGANVYLTPPNSQGFAPHYDDIEAFVIQIEGKKEWKLYNPSKDEELPRFSSHNFNQDEIGKPILEETLEAGNVLYFPRGTIHQANTVPGFHSLHITLSVYQKQSYADLFEKLFPMILEEAIKKDIEIRRGLPLHIWNNMGTVYADTQSNEREEVLRHVRDCMKRAIAEIPIDNAVDQLAKKFQHEALPPEIKASEKCRTIFGDKNYLNENGEVMSNIEITLQNRIRILRAHILRLVEEQDALRIYFYTNNSKQYKEFEPNFIEIEPECADAIEILIKCYPGYVYISDLPLKDDEVKLSFCQALFDNGLIMLHDIPQE